MGMAGHLVIVKRDLTVFAHVHPSGSMPMAGLMLLEKQEINSILAMIAMPGMPETAMPPEVTFPTGFPIRQTTSCLCRSNEAAKCKQSPSTPTSNLSSAHIGDEF
jgi:hypothetical protein